MTTIILILVIFIAFLVGLFVVLKFLSDLKSSVDKRLNEGLYQNSSIINKLHERLALIDEARENIKILGGEVANFSSILSNKQSRGAYGEMQMEQLVSDILPSSVYEFQAVLQNGKRVDCLIKTPAYNIAIDAKFPLEAYQALLKAKEERERIEAERFFRDSVIKHIKDISEKYVGQGDTTDSALMFLPSESVYAEIFSSFQNVVDAAFKSRVWIVSPTTLMATLTTIKSVLKDAKIKEQTKIIQKELGLLNEDMARLLTRVNSLDNHFRQVSKDVSDIVISTEKITKKSEQIQSIEVEKS